MAKHLIDIDEDKLAAARADFGTSTIDETVNEALTRSTSARAARVRDALDVLAKAKLADHKNAWH